MKRSRLIAVAAAALLAGGCADSGGEADAPTDAPTMEVTHRSEEPTEATAPAETESPDQAADEEPAEPERSDRGYITKTVGENAGFYASDMEPIFEFVMTDLVLDFECTYPNPDPSVNGHHLGMRFEVQTTADLPELGVDSMLMSMHDFLVWDAEGSRVNDTISGALLCLTDGDQLPNPIGPGESVNGWVVVDVPPGGGAVAYAPFGPGGGGWEWEYEG